MMNKINALVALLLLSISCFGQLKEYSYKQDIKGIEDTWHMITLPNSVLGNTKAQLSDLRIYGVQAADTIEAPYLIRRTSEEIVNEKVRFKQLNTTTNASGYFVTFSVPTKQAINRITTQFNQSNFDWQLKLEGSQNQQTWFTLLDDYRILSIKNGQTNYKFTDLVFPDAKYRYYRIHVKTKEKVTLSSANLLQRKVKPGTFKSHSIKVRTQKENAKLKQTELEIDLGTPLSVNQLQLSVKNKFDYYRPITIQALTDSVKTANGQKYSYRTLASGTLNSMETNRFSFGHTVVQKLKIIIRNQDNQPLSIGDIAVQGYLHQLVARFTEPGDYVLAYGNKAARTPQYDIKRFTSNIPVSPSPLKLGPQEVLNKDIRDEVTEPLFSNQIWLWLVMGIIILLLGGFTFSMLKKV